MTTPVVPDPSNPTPPAAPSPSGGAPGSSPPVTPPAEFRFGNDVDPWARGKTAAEILGIARQLNSTLEGVVRNGPPAQTPAPAPAYTPTQPQTFAPDEYVTGAGMQSYAEQVANRLAQGQRETVEMVAESNLDRIKERYAEHFQKYGPQINANLALLTDKRAWTIDNLAKVVKITLVDHIDDLARSGAERIVAEMGPTFRSTGAGGLPISQPNADYTLKSEKLPEDFRERAAKVGLTLEVVDEFCRAQDMSREDWFKLFGSTAITEGRR